MDCISRLVAFWLVLLTCVTGVRCQEATGVIVTSIVAAVLLIILVLGVAIFCLVRQRRRDQSYSRSKKKKKRIFIENEFHPPPVPVLHDKRHPYASTGYISQKPPPLYREPLPIAPPPQPISIPLTSRPVISSHPTHTVHPIHQRQHGTAHPPHYATYHGQPAEMRNYAPRTQNDTVSGPPPIVIPFGTVAVRPDPRPVVHKKSRRKRESDTTEGKRKSSRHRSLERHSGQEFVVQQSYDGIPVIRPVIYVDDDEHSRKKHRSKSREGRYKKRSTEPSPAGPRITEIRHDASSNQEETTATIETPPAHQSLTPQPSQGIRSAERSRTSSVTEAVRALKQSVMGYADDSDSSDLSRAPSFTWAHRERSPPPGVAQPKAGDVMYFPAGTHVETERHTEPPKLEPVQRLEAQNDPYVYTKVIKSSVKERRASPELVEPSRKMSNEGYEVPLSRSVRGTRDEEKTYETEHGRPADRTTNIGASMSDRLQNVVETGNKTRFTHYNIGAMNFGDEEDNEINPAQIRTRRPDTPPDDTPSDHIYARAIKRPESPPNDIPLVSPRESREVPPLDLHSAVGSRSDQSYSYRPSTPPTDFPITPRSSFISPRPRTPPSDFPMTPRNETNLAIPVDADLTRSLAVDPSTGEPGSFQARQRLIEAHLQRNSATTNVQSPKSRVAPTPSYTQKPAPPPAPVIELAPGEIPPAPPPPPIPN